MSAQQEMQARYGQALMGVFGAPSLVLVSGDGAEVVDADGRRYLDLLAGIAVNALGHGHPALVDAVTTQARELVHVSNFFTTAPQIELAERLLRASEAPEGSRVFFCNSGAEANEAAFKLARRTGRPHVVVAEGAFHGRTMGALSLTSKQAYREPFEPLVPGVTRVPFNDVEALRAAVDSSVGAVILEPIQGEAGVIEATPEYLREARRITDDAGALLIFDEVQTGMGRTGSWFGFQTIAPDVRPDAMTIAKGLGGGVPIGGLVTFGETATLLGPGQHGTTFGGNPLACAAGVAVMTTIEAEGLLDAAVARGEALVDAVAHLDDPRIDGVRGRGLLRAIVLAEPVAVELVTAAREAGFIVNAPAPDVIRLAPPLVITDAQLASFVAALPGSLDAAETAAAQAPRTSDAQLSTAAPTDVPAHPTEEQS